MFTGTKLNLVSKMLSGWLIALLAVGAISSNAAHASDAECSFTVKPVAVCEISFYKLLATPERYSNKYIAVTGFVAISNGRLAIYPTERSYKLSIEQDSFSIEIPMKERVALAHDLGNHYARVVGLFHYRIIDDYRPGIGYISKLVDANLVGSRPDVPEDHYLTGTPQEILH